MTLARKYSEYIVLQQFVETLLLQNGAVAMGGPERPWPPLPQGLLVPPHFGLLKLLFLENHVIARQQQ